MRSANDVALELIAQDVGVATLGAGRHRLAHPGESLMSIQATQLDDLAVEFETVICELGFAESEPPVILIQDFIAAAQPHTSRIQISFLQIPQADSLQAIEAHGVRNGIADRSGSRQRLGNFRDDSLAIQ